MHTGTVHSGGSCVQTGTKRPCGDNERKSLRDESSQNIGNPWTQESGRGDQLHIPPVGGECVSVFPFIRGFMMPRNCRMAGICFWIDSDMDRRPHMPADQSSHPCSSVSRQGHRIVCWEGAATKNQDSRPHGQGSLPRKGQASLAVRMFCIVNIFSWLMAWVRCLVCHIFQPGEVFYWPN